MKCDPKIALCTKRENPKPKQKIMIAKQQKREKNPSLLPRIVL